MGNENMNDKLKIWNALEKTNPAHTKPVRSKYGKMITTIDAMHQIKNMTAAFGPVGKGWSYDVKYHYAEKLIFAEVKIRYCLEDQWYSYGPVCSVAPLGNKKGLDDEAPKKAMTDALTKAFSHIGLNADIFLGKFDNNKYVEEVNQHFKQNSVGVTTGSTSNNGVANNNRQVSR